MTTNGGGPLPYLTFGGVEIANAARTLSYLRRGLGGTLNGHWELGPGDVCGVLYRVDGGTCVSPAAFVNPAVDPAPWYDPNEPGSATFLGVVLLDIQGYDSTVKRATTTRLSGLGGGTLSAKYREPRTWKFRGAMISSDDAGAEFGLRWLVDVLQGTNGHCTNCGSDDLVVRLSCPPADCSDDRAGMWTSYQSALTEGPMEKEPWGPARLRTDSDVLAGCRDWVTVEWTMVSANPFLYRQPVLGLPPETLTFNCTDEQLDSEANQRILTMLAPSPSQGRRALRALPVANPVTDTQTFGFHRNAWTTPTTGRSARSEQTLAPLAVCDFCTWISGASQAPCLTVQPPLRGVTGAIFTLSSVSGVGRVDLDARPDCNIDVDLLAMSLSGVAAGSTVVVDCSQHTVTVTDASGVVSDGQHLLVIDPGETIEWIELADCLPAFCVCVEPVGMTAGEDLTVTISTQAREG